MLRLPFKRNQRDEASLTPLASQAFEKRYGYRAHPSAWYHSNRRPCHDQERRHRSNPSVLSAWMAILRLMALDYPQNRCVQGMNLTFPVIVIVPAGRKRGRSSLLLTKI